MTVKILGFSGSARTESHNKKLVKIACTGAQQAGAEVTLIDLRDYPMPIFDEDLETAEGMPEFASRFKQLMIQSDGLLISSPEYNSSYSALLKNAIDWASRSESSDTQPLSAFKGKCVSLMSASPGNLGGLRGLVSLRMLLGNLGMIVLPGQIAISRAGQSFTESGLLVDEKQQSSIEQLGKNLVDTLEKLTGNRSD